MLAPTALAALALAASPLDPELAVAAGAGYDSNLSHAKKSLALGAGYVDGRASGGASMDLGETTSLYGGLRLDGESYASYSGLSTGSAGVELSLLQEISDSAALLLTPLAARSWSGDGARDATLLSATLTFRVRPRQGLALRASYGRSHADASDPAFSYDRDRLGLSVEFRLAEGSYLTLGYSADLGQDVFYRDLAGGLGGMLGGMVGTFGRLQEAFRAFATSQSLGPALELGLGGGGAFLEASYAFRTVSSSAGDYQSHSVHAGLGWRL